MWQIEITDTFAGESNYSWVKRSVSRAQGVRSVRQAVKELAGWRCRVFTEDLGDFRVYRPTQTSGICQIAYATWRD